MSAKISLVGQTFARLTVLADLPPRNQASRSLVRCQCGTEFAVDTRKVAAGYTRSCGCLQRERTSEANHKHGHGTTKTRTYQAWRQMKRRCLSPSVEAFKRYGGAGITVCPQWKHSFEAFLSCMGECPEGMEIDRFPNKTGNYEPGNCRWATVLQQARNKTNNRVFTIAGKTACLSELCEDFGVPYSRVQGRLHRGWTIEEALLFPRQP